MASDKSIEGEIDLRPVFYTLWRRRWIILATIVAAAVAGAAVNRLFLRPVYESRTQILLSEHSAPAYATPESAARLLTGLAFLEPLARTSGIRPTGRELQRLVVALPVRDTRIVELRIRYEDPTTLRRFTEAVVKAFMDRASLRVEERRGVVRERLAAVEAQLREVARTLRVTRQTLQRLGSGVPGGSAGWFARSFVVNSIGTSEGVYAGLLSAQRELGNDLLKLEFPTLLQEPYVPATPASARLPLTVGVAGALGLIIGIVLAFTLEALWPATNAPAASRPDSARSAW